MAQEEKKMDEQISEEKATEDNPSENFDLVDELLEFNSPEEAPKVEEDSEGSKEEAVEVEKAESNDVQSKKEDEKQTEPEAKPDESWLIDGKFRDDNEGRADLAKSYKEMQSMHDKTRNDFEEAKVKVAEGEKLAQFFRDNPDAVEAMQGVISKKTSATEPPPMPEDFDSMDIYAEGTPTNEWYNANREFERKQIIGEVVGAVRGELGARDAKTQEEQDHAEYINFLRTDENMSDNQIEDYLAFMTNDDNVTTKNMVKVWKVLSGQEMEIGASNENPLPRISAEKRKVPSAAAISGTTPPNPTSSQEQKEWEDNLMQFSKNY